MNVYRPQIDMDISECALAMAKKQFADWGIVPGVLFCHPKNYIWAVDYLADIGMDIEIHTQSNVARAWWAVVGDGGMVWSCGR